MSLTFKFTKSCKLEALRLQSFPLQLCRLRVPWTSESILSTSAKTRLQRPCALFRESLRRSSGQPSPSRVAEDARSCRNHISRIHLSLGSCFAKCFAALTYLLMCLFQDGEDVVNFLKSSSPMIAVLSCCHVNTSAQAEESRRWVSMGGR